MGMAVEAENERLIQVINAAQVVAGECVTFGSVEAKTERLLLAQQLRTLAETIAVTAAGEADLGDVASANSAINLPAFIGRETSDSPTVVRGDVKLAAWLRSMPEVEAAFAAGRVSRQHVDRLRQLDSNPRLSGEFRAQQPMLIEFAETLDWRRFLAAVRYWMLANDPDGAEPKEQIRNAGVRVRRHADGTVTGSFVFDPVRGAAFVQAFDTEMERVRARDKKVVELGGKRRSRFQQGADALTAVVSRGFGRPDGSIPAPLVSIVMSEAVAEQMVGRMTGEIDASAPFDLDADDVDGRCELIDGTPIHPWLAMAALSVGVFRRFVLDSTDRVIKASSSRRFPKHLRHLLLLESRGRCSLPGCDAPFGWLQGDHVTPYSKGGPTSHRNGQMLCGPHNRHKRDRLPVG